MIKRQIDDELLSFFRTASHEALLIDGTRQVGKTFSIREFGRRNFKSVVEINFVQDPKAKDLFKDVSSETDVLMRLSAMPGVRLIPHGTLIFFDEVQECPEVVTYIKFLVEEGSYRYVLSGSLLGVELKDVRSVPVGYLREVRMFPLSFGEFVRAMGLAEEVIEHLRRCWQEEKPVDLVVHDRLNALLRIYLVVGGMPAAVQTYLDTKNIAEVVKVQQGILVEYRKDASKYAKGSKMNILRVLDLLPEELNRKNKRFHVSDVKAGSRLERLEDNFIWLQEAGVALSCPVATEARVPLRLTQNSNFFKLFMNDVGLLSALYMDGIQFKILSGETKINNGAVYENFLAQELAFHGFPLHYYNGEDVGEVDFIVEKDAKALPLEVKSGRHYKTHAALDGLLKKHDADIPCAIVFSNANYSRQGKISYWPLYQSMFLDHDGLPADARYELPSLDVRPRENH